MLGLILILASGEFDGSLHIGGGIAAYFIPLFFALSISLRPTSNGIGGVCWCKLPLLVWGRGETAVPPVRIGMHVWPGFEPMFLARHAGNLGGRDFRLVEFLDFVWQANGHRLGHRPADHPPPWRTH